MLFTSTFVAISSFFVVARAAVLDTQSTACFTTHTGYFEEGNQEFGLNSQNQVIFPSNGTKFKVSLQACPQLTKYGIYDYPGSYYGRLVALETATIKANQCLTTFSSATKAGILYVKLADCGSEYVPPPNQSWAYMDDDFGNELLFAGQCEQQSGFVTNTTTGDPLPTNGTHLLQLGCIDVIGEGFGTMTLSGTWN